jgi:SNF2 family DNA or RNA helicase
VLIYTTQVDDEAADEADSERKPPIKKAKKPKKGKSSKAKGKNKAKEKKTHKSLAQLRAEGIRSKKARKKYMRRLAKDWIDSAKIKRTMALLEEIHENNPEEKVLIFSQFTSLLDLLEVPMLGDGQRYRRYDGSMTSIERNDAVMHFKENRHCRVMLVSLKAGNAGLNLNCASQVIIMDPFWNPYIEEQAIDRAHRIGQMNPVKVHRVLVPGTVEDRIVTLQDKKRDLISAALDENAGKNVARLGERELAFLFVSLILGISRLRRHC